MAADRPAAGNRDSRYTASPEVAEWLIEENAKAGQPHCNAQLLNGEWNMGCWCGDVHDPDWVPTPEDEWEPCTVADLRSIYADASRARTTESLHWLKWRLRYAKWRLRGGGPP